MSAHYWDEVSHIACDAVVLFYADMYSLEYSGILYVLSYPILVSMACLLTSCNIQICKTLPLTGPGGDQLLTPSLQLFLLLKQYIYILCLPALCRICMCCVIQEYVIIHEKSKSTCSRCTGGPGRLLAPPPSPAPLAELGGGGGRRLASHVLPGDFERGRGDLWQVNLAGHTRGWIWHVSMARHFGGFTWRVSLAHLFGGF